jgi:hypothetical protein
MQVRIRADEAAFKLASQSSKVEPMTRALASLRCIALILLLLMLATDCIEAVILQSMKGDRRRDESIARTAASPWPLWLAEVHRSLYPIAIADIY